VEHAARCVRMQWHVHAVATHNVASHTAQHRHAQSRSTDLLLLQQRDIGLCQLHVLRPGLRIATDEDELHALDLYCPRTPTHDTQIYT
jgi:hypothetical protein